MIYRPVATAIVLLLLQPARNFDPLHGSLARDEPQAIYATDLSFATPPRLDGDPVLAPLATRCAGCHGPGPGVGQLMTFAKSGRPATSVDRLVTAQNVHAGDVAKRKMGLEDFKAAVRQW